MNEEAIIKDLTTNFPCLENNIRLQRARRIFATVPREKFGEVFKYITGEKGGFSVLLTITGFDEGENLAAMYHMARLDGITLSLKVSVPKTSPVLKTISDAFPAADAYEREMIDLLGMRIEGLREGKRYPLPDNWPAGQYPLRKDWKPAAPGKGGTENA
jgi:Ni,Fe-hydrogenase III component G